MIKSLFSILSSSIIAAALIFAPVSMVFAQTSSPTTPPPPSSLPQIDITDLATLHNLYKAGDTITGSFVISNDGTTFAPNIYYRFELTGGYGKDGLPTIRYDEKDLSSVSLDVGASQTIQFSYTIPASLGGTGFGVRIQALTQAAILLGWEDYDPITIIGGTGYAQLTDDYLSVGTSTFDANDGPTIYQGQSASYTVVLENPGTKALVLTPTISIFNRTYTGTPITTYTASTTTIAPGKSSTLSFPLPMFNYKPLVYAGTLTFNDANGNQAAPVRQFRYIVNGPIATIQLVSTSVNSLSAQEPFSVMLGYTGTPADITTGQTFDNGTATATVTVYNQDNQSIATANQPISLNSDQLTTITIPLVAGSAAQSATVSVAITKNGNSLSTYSGTLFTNPQPQQPVGSVTTSSTSFVAGHGTWVFILIGILFILLLIILFSIIRQGPGTAHWGLISLAIIIALIIIVLFGSYYIASASGGPAILSAGSTLYGVCSNFAGHTQGAALGNNNPNGGFWETANRSSSYPSGYRYYVDDVTDFNNSLPTPYLGQYLNLPDFINNGSLDGIYINGSGQQTNTNTNTTWQYNDPNAGWGSRTGYICEPDDGTDQYTSSGLNITSPHSTKNTPPNFQPGSSITVSGSLTVYACANNESHLQEVGLEIVDASDNQVVPQKTYYTGDYGAHGGHTKQDYQPDFSLAINAPTTPGTYYLNVYVFDARAIAYGGDGIASGTYVIKQVEIVVPPTPLVPTPSISPVAVSAPSPLQSSGYGTFNWSIQNYVYGQTVCVGSGSYAYLPNNYMYSWPIYIQNQVNPGGGQGWSSGTYQQGGSTTPITYTLSCSNPGSATSSASTEVYVNPKVTIMASPSQGTTPTSVNTSVSSGAVTTINWSVQNDSSAVCTAGGAWSGNQTIQPSGTAGTSATSTYTTSAITAPQTYTITCSNPGGGSDTESAIVYIKPTVSLSATPSTVGSGQTSNITWVVSPTSGESLTCTPTASDGDAKWQAISSSGFSNGGTYTGSANTSSISSGTTYTLTCVNPYGGSLGSASNNTSVSIGSTSNLPIINLTSNPTTVTTCDTPSTLTWAVSNATSCSASSVDSSWEGPKTFQSGSNSQSTSAFSNNQSVLYTLTCTNGNGSQSAQSTITFSGCNGQQQIHSPNNGSGTPGSGGATTTTTEL
jgi:hypothetical protein